MRLEENFKIEDLSAEIKEEIDAFIIELKKYYPNVEAVIVFDDPSHINDNTDDEINVCVVSDDFQKSSGCARHIRCRGGNCVVSSHEEWLKFIADEAARKRDYDGVEVIPMPLSVGAYLKGDKCDYGIYTSSDLYYGDRQKYDPKTVYETFPWVIDDRKTSELIKEVLLKFGCPGGNFEDASKRLFIRATGVLRFDGEGFVNSIVNLTGFSKDKAIAAAKEIMEKRPGDKYEGEILNGKPHGKGKMYFADGTVYDGGFFKGGFVGKGTVYYKNGDRLEADFERKYDDGCLDDFYGKGILYRADGTRYEGMFNYGHKYGKGVEYDKDGNVLFDCKWEFDERVPTLPSKVRKCIVCYRNAITHEDKFCCDLCYIRYGKDMDFEKKPRYYYEIAENYEKGELNWGKDIKKAKFYYKKAADKGYKEAIDALKRLEKDGK